VHLTSGHDAPQADEPTVIFLHIATTGGMALRSILHRHFPSSAVLVLGSADREPSRPRPRREATLTHFASLPESTRGGARLIEGHTIFGLHELVPRPSTYITLLRDPVSLVISKFIAASRSAGQRLDRDVTSGEMSLDAFVRSGISLETDNSQTRALSGDTSTPFGECSDAMLEVAKSNIQERVSVAGLTERFDETLVLLRRTFGWSKLWYVRGDDGLGEPHEASPDTLRWIEQQNRLDVELYGWASRRFEEAAASEASVPDGLRSLHRQNS
jgi:galactose-3-O-sulfotransferase